MSRTPRRRAYDARLLAELLAGKPIRDAAKLAGCGESTARRRIHEPDFAARLRDARAETLDRAQRRLESAMCAAVEELRGLLSDDDARVRLAACREILASAMKLKETVDLEIRISKLEKLFDGRKRDQEANDALGNGRRCGGRR